jgi:hypothetical protein
MSDDNSLLSTTVYGVFVNADVPVGYTGFSGNTAIQQYACGQFHRNLSVFGTTYCNSIHGYVANSANSITGIGNILLSAETVNISNKITVSGAAVINNSLNVNGTLIVGEDITINNYENPISVLSSLGNLTDNLSNIINDTGNPTHGIFCVSVNATDEVRTQKIYSADINLTNNMYRCVRCRRRSWSDRTDWDGWNGRYCRRGTHLQIIHDSILSFTAVVHMSLLRTFPLHRHLQITIRTLL